MSFSPITLSPTPPQRGDDPETFDVLADPFVVWMATHAEEMDVFKSELEVLAAVLAVASVYADAGLVSIANLDIAADEMLYGTAANTFAKTSLSAFARTLLDDANAAAARTTLGLGTAATSNTGDFDAAGTASSAVSAHVAAGDPHTQYLLESAVSAFALTFLDDTDAAAVRTTLGIAAAAASSGTASSGYMDIPTTGLGTIRKNWGRTTVGANSTSTPSLAASYTTALSGTGQAMTSATSDSDSSYCYLSSTSQMTIANGTDGSLTFQWEAWGVV